MSLGILASSHVPFVTSTPIEVIGFGETNGDTTGIHADTEEGDLLVLIRINEKDDGALPTMHGDFSEVVRYDTQYGGSNPCRMMVGVRDATALDAGGSVVLADGLGRTWLLTLRGASPAANQLPHAWTYGDNDKSNDAPAPSQTFAGADGLAIALGADSIGWASALKSGLDQGFSLLVYSTAQPYPYNASLGWSAIATKQITGGAITFPTWDYTADGRFHNVAFVITA